MEPCGRHTQLSPFKVQRILDKHLSPNLMYAPHLKGRDLSGYPPRPQEGTDLGRNRHSQASLTPSLLLPEHSEPFKKPVAVVIITVSTAVCSAHLKESGCLLAGKLNGGWIFDRPCSMGPTYVLTYVLTCGSRAPRATVTCKTLLWWPHLCPG